MSDKEDPKNMENNIPSKKTWSEIEIERWTQTKFEIEIERWTQQMEDTRVDFAIRQKTNDIQKSNIRKSIRTNALNLTLRAHKQGLIPNSGLPMSIGDIKSWADEFVEYIERED